MKPFIMTLLLAIGACVSGVIAWRYSPKNEVGETNSRIGEILLTKDAENAGPLLPTESDHESAYDSNDVYRIKVERYDRELDSPKKIEISRERGSWVIPDKYEFLASNAQRISGVIDSLRQKRILDMPSDQQNDHEEFGVVELGASDASRSGVGTTLILEDTRRNTLARVIIGKPAADPAQRFVRIPGQPQIYVIEFDQNLLSTEFSDWIDGDLLRFGNQRNQLGEMIESIEIDYYFIDPRKLATDATRTYVYRARIYPAGERWLYDVWPADSEQKLVDRPLARGAEINLATLGEFLGEIVAFKLRDVQKKSASAAQDLAAPAESNPADHFDWLVSRGYRHAGFTNGQHQFDSLAGCIRIRYRNGNVDTLAIGDLAGVDMQNRSNINRFLLVSCGVDETMLPMPVNPGAGNSDDSSSHEAAAESANEPVEGEAAGSGAAETAAVDAKSVEQVQEDDAALREYQKRLNDRKTAMDQANGRARNLNQIHADWLYVISQNAVNKLFPSIESLAKPPAQSP